MAIPKKSAGLLASAKTKLAAVAKRAGPLKKGDALTFTNRLYAVVDSKGRPIITVVPLRMGTTGAPAIFTTRIAAANFRDPEQGQRVVRLDDIKGIVQ